MRLLSAALAAVTLLAVSATAATTFEAVRPGAEALGADLAVSGATIGFLDADGDNRVDEANPDEPAYVDVDHDGRASYGDIRLTAFAAYPAGTRVDFTSRDFGLTLAQPAGWFATGEEGWYLDFDFTGTVTEGDLRADGPRAATKAHAGDSDLGDPLTQAQVGMLPASRIAVRDLDHDGRAGLDEPLYLDMDGASPTGGARRVSVGDVRIVPGKLSVDDGPTRAEFDDAVAQAAAGRDTEGNPVLAAEVQDTEAKASWRVLDWILVAVGVLNLAGLAIVYKAATQPRHPFK
ncbi:MAG: hypothetical protein QOD77_2050 [Thermoplasmata archaeon]|jgi:hypothetical protein|nr:hypothetical protein [Thermoplasmata archaeon]